MNRGALVVLGAVPVVGLLVYLVGVAMAPEGVAGVLIGVLVGCVLQLLLIGVAQVAFPGKPLAAYAVGMLGRLLAVIIAALVLVPLTRQPAGPMLLSLVSVLFATTLLEPVALAAGRRTKS